MKIGIIGSGLIGAPLGRLWTAVGHEVMFSSRHPETLKDLAAIAGKGARIGTIDEAAEFGDVILEAIPFKSIPDLPADKFVGKLVLSAANYYPARDGQIDLGGMTQSEWVASHLPGAKVVKAFNMMRADVIEALADGNGTPSLAILIAGDHENAKAMAGQLIRDAKFEPVDVGSLADSAVFQAPDAPLYNVRLSPKAARQQLAKL